MVRGLRARLGQLRYSRSADRVTLEAESNRTISQFVNLKSQMKLLHAEGWRSAMTEWDILIDKQFAAAERDTLHIINQERQQSKKLISDFVENKAKQKKKYESDSAELKQKRDEGSSNRKTARDSIKAKLDRERTTIEQQMHECREWVGIRTGDTTLQDLTASSTSANTDEMQSISDLPSIAKRFDEIQKTLFVCISRMKNHPVSKMLGAYWFLGFGSVLGAIAAAISWSLGSVPLIVGIVGIIGSILFTAIIHFATAPLVTRTIRRMFPQVVEQENLAYSVLAHGRRIADFNCQQEINRLDKQYVTSQQSLDDDHREKRTKQLSEFDSKKKALTLACGEKRKVIAASRREKHQRIHSDRKPKVEALEKRHAVEDRQSEEAHAGGMGKLESNFQRSQQRTVRRWFDGCKGSADLMSNVYNQALLDFPNWDSDTFSSGEWPRLPYSLAWRVGDIEPLSQFQRELKSLALPDESPQQPWSVF